MKKLIQIFTVAVLFSSIHINNVLAHDNETHYDRINLSASASAQLKNDTMVATVYAEEEGGQASELSSLVNTQIRWGLDLVKTHPEIKYQTNSYSTNPVYSNKKIKGWRVRQSLRLESQDMAQMSDVLGRLQDKLALQSMQFTVSAESLKLQDGILIDEALEAFKKRATQVVKKLGRKDYKIVDINISTSGDRGGSPQYEMRSMQMSSLESAPAISAGEQTVSVTVNGNIELE